MVVINHAAHAEALRRANERCEWVYITGERCQNTMSLNVHHRTYVRQGREWSSDLTICCPAHHMLADVVRKIFVPQRIDIILERTQYVFNKKLAWLNGNADKFMRRVSRETYRLNDELDRAWTMRMTDKSHDKAVLQWWNTLRNLCIDPMEKQEPCSLGPSYEARLRDDVSKLTASRSG